MKLGRLATSTVFTIAPGDTLDRAISLMEEHDIHHLPVVEASSIEPPRGGPAGKVSPPAGGRLVGMLSDRDLLLAVGWKLSRQRRLDDDGTRTAGPDLVREVMSQPLVSLSPDNHVHTAAQVMINRRISAIPLTDEADRLLGIVTKMDLLTRFHELTDAQPGLSVLRESAADHMRANVFTVGPRELLHVAARLMHEKHIRHLPVLARGELVGMVTDRDLRRACGEQTVADEQAEAAGEFYIGPTTVHECMSRKVQTIAPETRLVDAAGLMTARRIGALPVLRDRRMVAILTDTDIVRAVGQSDEP